MSAAPIDPDAEHARHVVAELRERWLALPPPEGATDGVPAEPLEACDAVTRAVVERVQAAYRAQPAPVPHVPIALRVAQRERWVPRRRGPKALRRSLAAAALLVVAWGAWGALERSGVLRPAPSPAAVHVARAPLPAGAHGRSGAPPPVPRSLDAAPVAHDRAAIFDVPREQLRLRSDGFEYLSGAVRIVLIQPTDVAPEGRPLSDRTGEPR